MTKEEFEQVFVALGLFWPRENVTDSRKSAWWVALKPFAYQGGVREKIIDYARSPKGNFFPDVADLTAGLTPVVVQAERHVPDWIDELLEKMPPYTSGPLTQYASAHGCTIGEACKALYGCDSIMDIPEDML